MHVTLDLDSIVQVLDRHLHDSSTGMMTRIAVLKWLYHLYIKTPRKVRTNRFIKYGRRVEHAHGSRVLLFKACIMFELCADVPPHRQSVSHAAEDSF